MTSLFLCVALAAADVPIPASSSPDGQWHLAATPSDRAGDHAPPLILQRAGHAYRLDPGANPIGDKAVLFAGVTEAVRGDRSLDYRDFEYSITWSPDSRYLAIDGGAHKFWTWVVYSVEGGTPHACRLPPESEVAAAARSSAQRTRATEAAESEPFVRAIRPGVFAVHAHPFTCCDASAEDVHVYVLVDFTRQCHGRVAGTAQRCAP